MAIRELHPLTGERDFRWRSANPTRVEALTDMVFALSITLLVVSNAPPSSFADLTGQMWGFPGFAAAFGLVLWHSHYIFFRRYALEDAFTTALNAALLFLIVFFVYPLKYPATMLSAFLRSVAEGAPDAPMTLAEATAALAYVSIGYAAVFLMFVLLYTRALYKADQLELSPREKALTRFGVAEHWVHVAVGLSVALLASILPVRWAPFSGFGFFVIGPMMFAMGSIFLSQPKRK